MPSKNYTSPKQRLEAYIKERRDVGKMDESDEKKLRDIFTTFMEIATESTIISAFRGLRNQRPKGGE